jgi:hypothetical protein
MSRKNELTPELLETAQAVAVEFAEVMRSPLTTSKQRFLREVVVVTRAAAIAGEYRDALRGYEVVGRILGHLVDEQKHLHLHAGNASALTRCSDEELIDMIRIPAAPDPPAEPTDAELAAFLADLKSRESEAALVA